MPPLRSMPAIKPTKTERSHEENQERAYIAASRRSDRSLEARVESARRASEIHEKRTGRKLRVTEQDVINEEMYEEEDDNVPWRYRHLSMLPNLSTLSPDFRRRVEAQLVLEMERSRMVDPYNQFGNLPLYMNPGMMQSPHSTQQSPMFPPQTYSFGQQTPGLSSHSTLYDQSSPSMPLQMHARNMSKHRSTPYPIPNAEQQQQQHPRPSVHQRSASIATPAEKKIKSEQTPSATPHMEDRRMSLPPQNMQQTSHPADTAHSPSTQCSEYSQSNKNTSPSQSRSQVPSHQSFTGGSYYGSSGSYQSTNNPFAPLTSVLPLNTQQILGDGMFDIMGERDSPMMNPNMASMNQPMYSYNPNANTTSSKKRSYDQISTTTGLDQTLMPTSLATTVDANTGDNFYDTNSNSLNSAATDPSFSYGFNDEGFGLDAFNSSGYGSPDEFASFVNDDSYADHSLAF